MLRIAAFMLLLTGSLAGQATPDAIKVWAIGDSYRINPISGKAFEDNTLLFPDALTGDYRDRNLVWDGAASRVSLRAARNEIVAFQVIVERPGRDTLKDVNVAFEPWKGPTGHHFPPDAVRLYKEWYVDVAKRSAQNYSLGTGWYADALIPCSKWTGRLFPRSYILPFDIPDHLNNIGPGQRNQAMWVDIYVPRDRNAAPP